DRVASQNYFISEEFAMDTVLRLPEVRESDAYIRRVTKGKRHLSSLVYGEPDSVKPYYWIAVGEDNGMAFVTHFGFRVYENSGKVRCYETIKDTASDLASWRQAPPHPIRTYRQHRYTQNGSGRGTGAASPESPSSVTVQLYAPFAFPSFFESAYLGIHGRL